MSNAVENFRQLHRNTSPLRLPNAWDAASARLFESLGASAIATTSAGLAWSLGYPDGRLLPIEETVHAASNMVRILEAPLSIDVENGYSDDPKKVAENVMRLVGVGVVGINIEDGSDDPELLAFKIDAIRNAASKAGTDLFINARSDVFLANLVEPSKLVEESVARGLRYASAGADGLFLPGIKQGDHITAVVDQISLPLNTMAWPGLGDATNLGELGVRRLSAGSAISQAVWGHAGRLAEDFLKTGRSDTVSEGAMAYSQLQGLFA
ncbi:PEP phosphonomutase [Bordetella genomosp. 8]|uniref:PEP phosphonomutase n=1 Tax=Bordetella genomosp. 8 TaxID=1416806 RepID=A0A1W6YPG8_9BORD|nr:isocitrate lyase/phosphoenolpyruvate mutase family protein [Bordetella genomosp. 8]ARP82967.1 PEP phosphonomutase [Bordetella genomosp. 8]